MDKVQRKGYCVGGFVVNGVREPIPFTFGMNKSPDKNFFRAPETLQY